MNCFKNHNLTDNIKPAFTLAEVLITLVVIGVIAALTIPALIANIQDAQYKTAWTKAFADISQASLQLAADNGGSLKGIFTSDDAVRDKLSPYLSYVKKCDDNSALGQDGCWNSKLYYLCGEEFHWWDMDLWSRMVLSNGILLAFGGNSTCTMDRTVNDNGCAYVGIDINGFKGPNTLGKDIYWAFITEDGSLEPFGTQGDFWTSSTLYSCDLNLRSDAAGWTCAADYLRKDL